MKQIDRIRKMNAEEICKEYGGCILSMTCELCPADSLCSISGLNGVDCISCFKAWLESEVEE